MSDPTRLVNEAIGMERRLLRAWKAEGPRASSKAKTLAVVTAVGAGLAATTSATEGLYSRCGGSGGSGSSGLMTGGSGGSVPA